MMKKILMHNQLFLTPLSKLIWGICLFVFFVHQILQHYGWVQIKWVDNWLDPFLFPIVVLPLLRWERQLVVGLPTYRLSGIEILAMVLVLMLASEILLPWLSPRFMYDPIDFVFIAVGGMVYYLFMQ